MKADPTWEDVRQLCTIATVAGVHPQSRAATWASLLAQWMSGRFKVFDPGNRYAYVRNRLIEAGVPVPK